MKHEEFWVRLWEKPTRVNFTTRALSLTLLLGCLLVRTAWAQVATPRGSYLNVRAFGARGDGAALDTKAIQK
jgi:polygalacturonase